MCEGAIKCGGTLNCQGCTDPKRTTEDIIKRHEEVRRGIPGPGTRVAKNT